MQLQTFNFLPSLSLSVYELRNSNTQKNMSYFNGCNNFVIFNPFILSLLLFSLGTTARENFLLQLSTREELVAMAGYGEDKLSNVLATGTVVCEACFHGQSQLQTWPISGAVVAVTCNNRGRKGKTNRAEAVTDEYGEFIIDIPSELHAIPNLDERCSVRVLRIPKSSSCRASYHGKQKGLKFSSVGNNIRTYTAGNINFLHSSSRPTQACITSGGNENDMAW